MPGYDCPVIMAAGAFIQGASIELSADAPMRPPYTVYLQGGLTFEIDRRRFAVRLTAPYSDERRHAASELAKKNGLKGRV